MARLNVEFEALTDPRFSILGRFLGAPDDTAHAVGLYHAMRVWAYCTQQSIYRVQRSVLDAIHPRIADGLITSHLGIQSRRKVYVAGTKGRIEWLEKLRESNRKRQMSHRQRNALVTRDNPGALTPTPALALSPSEVLSEKTTTLVRSKRSDAARVPTEPATRTKPSRLVNGERAKIIEANFSTLYEFYPRHVGRSLAWRAFVKLDPDADTLHRIAADVKRRTDTGEWIPSDPERVQFIPHMATYLNQRRWTDEH